MYRKPFPHFEMQMTDSRSTTRIFPFLLPREAHCQVLHAPICALGVNYNLLKHLSCALLKSWFQSLSMYVRSGAQFVTDP